MTAMLWKVAAVMVLGGQPTTQQMDAREKTDRLAFVREAVDAWTTSIEEYDVWYDYVSTYTPACPWAKLSKPVKLRTVARAAKSGERELYYSKGPVLGPGGVAPGPYTWEVAYNGEYTLQRTVAGSMEMPRAPNPAMRFATAWFVRHRGRADQVGGLATPPLIAGIVQLAGDLRRLFENAEFASVVASASCRELSPDGRRWEVVITFVSGARHVFVVDTQRACLPVEGWCYRADGKVQTHWHGIQYKVFDTGVLYPVCGTEDEFTPEGELYHSLRFKVHEDKTKLNPPEGLPDSVFRIEIPDDVDVIDVDGDSRRLLTGAELRRSESAAPLR